MWKLEGGAASFRSPRFGVRVNLKQPALGLLDVELPTVPPSPLPTHRLFALEVDGSSLSEAYVRGDDLVATYAESPTQPCAVQVYWRVDGRSEDQSPVLANVEMILSVQTNRLYGDPQVLLTTELPSQDLTVGEDFVFVRPDGWSVQICEVAHPSNLSESSRRIEDDHIVVRRSFFPGRLEKGVIRRARVRLVILNASDPATVSTLLEQFVASPPPLTA